MQGKTSVNGGDRSSRFKRKPEAGLPQVRSSRAIGCTVSSGTGVLSSAFIHSFKPSTVATGLRAPRQVLRTRRVSSAPRRAASSGDSEGQCHRRGELREQEEVGQRLSDGSVVAVPADL